MTNPAGNSTSAIDPTGARLATSSGGTTAFTLGDLHGNIAGQVNSAITTVLSALRYDPYGLEAPGGGSYDSGGSFTNPWRYQGRLDVSPDAANPLYDLSARFYSPWLGTFTQQDTVQGQAIDPRSLNRFLYVEGNPTSMSDPTGHISSADYYDDESWATSNGQLITNPDGSFADVYYKSDIDTNAGATTTTTGTKTVVTGTTVKYALQTGTPSVPYSIPAWAQPTFADSLIGPKVTSFEDLLLQARERDRQTYETLQALIGLIADLTGARPVGEALSRGEYATAFGTATLEAALLMATRGAKAPRGAPLFTQRTASVAFKHGTFKGLSIGEVAEMLRTGKAAVSELPVDVIVRNGEVLGLNNRSMLALRRAGIPVEKWSRREVSGDAFFENMLTDRLRRNSMATGADTIRVTPAGGLFPINSPWTYSPDYSLWSLLQ